MLILEACELLKKELLDNGYEWYLSEESMETD